MYSGFNLQSYTESAEVTEIFVKDLKGVRHGLWILNKFRLNFSISSFVIRFNLLHPQPSLLLLGLLLPL